MNAILIHVHTDVFAGGHLGRDKPLEKICSRFYWGRGMAEEIKEFVRTCDKCQKVNLPIPFITASYTFESSPHFHEVPKIL